MLVQRGPANGGRGCASPSLSSQRRRRFPFTHFALSGQPSRSRERRRNKRSWQGLYLPEGTNAKAGRFRAWVLQKLHISQREHSCTFCLGRYIRQERKQACEHSGCTLAARRRRRRRPGKFMGKTHAITAKTKGDFI